MRILVCDDEESQYKAASRLIPECHDVVGLCGADLTKALNGIFQAAGLLCSDKHSSWTSPKRQFAGHDLVLVDNDLSVLEVDGAPLSAEGLIGYLRALTDIPYIVSLNKNQDVDFDLRSLFGDDQSLADLAINTDHLKCKRLWEPAGHERFAPWYWPSLPDAVRRRAEQIDFVTARLNLPIWQALGFPELARHYLSRRARGALLIYGADQAMEETTFRQFFEGTRTLLRRQKQALGRLADEHDPDAARAVCRIVAADLDRWIRRDVLGPQDVLIDVPHLLAQMPFLLGERVGDLDHWDQAMRETQEPYGMDIGLYNHHVRDERFQVGMWAPSPCFWWPPLRGSRKLTEFFFAPGDWPDAVFCEDVSAFERADDDTEQPREVEVELEGSWPRRFIVEVDGRNYSPRSRLV